MNVGVLSTISRLAGGLHYSVRGLSKALAQQGCEMQIFSPRDAFSEVDLPVWTPLSVKLYSGYGPLKTSFDLRRILTDAGVDLLHLHGIWSDAQWAAFQHQKKTDTPVVVSPRGMLDPWAVENAAWKKRLVGTWFANEALQRASCIHALCRSELESIRAYGLDNPVAVIPNAVDLPELGERAPSEEKKKLLFLGRIHPKKGLKELLEAWSRGVEGWQLIVAGWDDGNHEQGLRSLVSSLGLNHSVSFVGSKYGEEKEQLLRQVDAVVLPSFSEGLPMSVLEAWAYGLPVMMTHFCNLPEGFEAGAAIPIDPNVDSIAEGLACLVNMQPSDLMAMGRAGRQLVEERFSWPSVAAEMRRVYEWCQSGGHPPDCIDFQGGRTG